MRSKLNILMLEQEKDIWEYRSDRGIPLYLMIRAELLRAMVYKNFDVSSPYLKKKGNLIRLKYGVRSLLNNPFRAKSADVMVFCVDQSIKGNNGGFYNRLYKHFYDSFSGTMTLIEISDGSDSAGFSKLKSPKVYYRDSIDVFIKTASLFWRISKKEKNEIEGFVQYLQKKGYSAIKASYLRKRLTWAILKSKMGFYIYRSLFKLKKPKLIILNAAFYGSLSFIIYAARSLGIKVVEYQHGYVGLNHVAYNFERGNLPEDIQQFLPSYFLTHGDYWTQNCRVPATCVTVGFPELERKAKQFADKHINKKDSGTILVISSGTVPKKVIGLITDFLRLSPSSNIILRPHPAERLRMNDRYGHLLDQGVTLDTQTLYKTLSQVTIVVGFEVSTVLYEATMFTNQIYLANDEYVNFYEPKSPFIGFKTSEDVFQKIQKNTQMELSSNYFWAQNSEKRFTDFLQSVLDETTEE